MTAAERRTVVLDPAAVVAKGGITSPEVARVGLGADVGIVQGQLAPGISLWWLPRDDAHLPSVVVPGNMGHPDTLVELVDRCTTR